MLLHPALVVNRLWQQRLTPFLTIGTGILASVLEREGHQVEVLDAVTEGWEQRGLMDDGWIEVGLPEEEIAARIRRLQPHVVGFSLPFSEQMPRLKSLARWVKAIHPEILVVCGGNQATCSARTLLEVAEVDAVVLGEGEVNFPRWLQRLQAGADFSGLSGIAFRSDDGKIIVRKNDAILQDLNQLPLPDYSRLPLSQYFKNLGARRIPLFTSRGCHQACAFCSIPSQHGTFQRRWSPRYIIEQIIYLYETFGVRDFTFDDDGFTADRDWLHDFFDLMIQEDLKLQWSARGGVVAANLTDDVLDKMKKTGGRNLTFMVGSGSRHILRNTLKKSVDLYEFESALQRIISRGFEVTCQFFLGAPGETIEEVYETLNYAWKLRTKGVDDFKFVMVEPLAGSALASAVESNRIRALFDQSLRLDQTQLEPADRTYLEIARIRDTAEYEFSRRGFVSQATHKRSADSRMNARLEPRYFHTVAPRPTVRRRSPAIALNVEPAEDLTG
jgi:radical SAM superfamily enzyme YgiQ (UPF0313 family)